MLPLCSSCEALWICSHTILRELGSIHASSGQLGLELAKPGRLEEELEKVQVIEKGANDWF